MALRITKTGLEAMGVEDEATATPEETSIRSAPAHEVQTPAVPAANPSRLTATANRLILAPDGRSLQVDLVRLDRTVPAAGCVGSRSPCPATLNVVADHDGLDVFHLVVRHLNAFSLRDGRMARS
jgi:hypothetical protein